MSRFLGVALVMMTITASPAAASVTQFWTVHRAADYKDAELNGTTVSADGVLHVGVHVEGVTLDGPDVAWSLAPDGDAVLVGTGPEGVLYRVGGGSARVADSTHVGQVLSLVRGPDGATYAGTAPDGHVLRWSAGHLETWFDTKDKYVWGLAWSGNTLFAATGPEGYLVAIRGHEKGERLFRAPSGQITAVVSDGAGGCFLATSGKGAIYHYADGKTRSLLEVAESDVKSLVYEHGVLYAAATSVAPVSWDAGSAPSGGEAARPVSSQEARSVVYRIVPDSSAASWWRSTQGIVFAMVPRDGGGVWAATGSRAGLYEINERGQAQAVYVASEGNATALLASGKDLWMATSGPARVYRVTAQAARGQALSPVFDSGRIARWGRFLAIGDEGTVRFSTRSGNTSTPDSTWSDWRSVTPGQAVASPSARYLQWRSELSGGTSAVREVRVAYAEVNQAPEIDDFTAYPEPGKFYKGEISPRQDPVTQVLPGGTRVQYSTPAPPPGAPEVMPTWAVGLRPLQWHATDPNNDPLLARLEYRKVGTTGWTLIDENLDTSPYTWDTNGLPDGDYEVRLTVDDSQREGADALSDQMVIGPIAVDHSPPTLVGLEARAEGRDVVVTGEARDAGLYVGDVEVRVGNGDWLPARALDGLWDSPSERFEARITNVEAGVQTVWVRATDAVGNTATTTTHVTVKP
jgi:hypothetical protein